MMRRVLLASSALALLSGAAYAADTVVYVPPAPPAPPAPVQGPAGYVEAGYGWVNIDDGFGGELNLDQIFIGGAANIPFGAWNFQLEVRDHQYLDGAILNTLATNLHIYSRNQSFAWGGFVGFETLSGIIDNYTVGLEAAGFFGPFTVVGQATYASLDPAVGPGSADLWTVRGVARYFVNPDLKLEAGLRYSNLSSGGVDVDFLTAEAEVEYKFGAAAVFGNAQYLFGGDIDPASVLALRLGARIHLGAASLLDQDRNGAGTFDTNPWLLP